MLPSIQMTHRISKLPPVNVRRRIVMDVTMESPGRIGSLLLNTRPIIVKMSDVVASKSMEDIAAVGSRQIEMGF